MIYDEKALGKFHNLNRVGRSLNGLNGLDGTMFRFDTIEALAAHYGADPAKVKQTLEAYNRDVAAGRDEAAGGLHGQERMTACSMPDCSVFGLIAGENAAAEHA